MNILLSLLSGVLLTFSFPSFDLYPLAWFALVPLLYALYSSDIKRALLYGLITGLCFNLTAFHWFLSPFLLQYSNLPWYISIIVYIIVGLYLALYYSAFAGLVIALRDRLNIPIHGSAPFVFLTLEFMRAKTLTGFPWELFGYSQYKFIPMIQIADITGVYGISFLLLFSNSTMTLFLKERLRFIHPVRRAFSLFLIMLFICLGYGYLRLNNPETGGERLRISLIQGNVPIEEKLSRDLRVQKSIIDRYGRMTTEVIKERPDLIVWPETAMPFIFGRHKESSESLLDFQKRLGIPLLTGIISFEDGSYSNSAIYIKDGRVEGLYSKIKLVPFGEYNPLGGTSKLIENFDYKQGKSLSVFDLKGNGISVLICYEIIFPELARSLVLSGARILLAISNDAWFGDTSAPYQHFSMAVFRAIENRTHLLRAANTGVTGIIDSNGRIVKTAETFVTDAVTADIRTGSTLSLYSRYGDIFTYLMISLSVLKIFYNCVKKEQVDEFSP